MKACPTPRWFAILGALSLGIFPVLRAQQPPAPPAPTPAEMAQINAALRNLVSQDPAAKPIVDKYPQWTPFFPAGQGGARGGGAAAANPEGGGAAPGGGSYGKLAQIAATPEPADYGDGPNSRGNIRKGEPVFPAANPPPTRWAGPQDPQYVAQSQANPVKQPRQMEKLGRGVIAMNEGEGKVWVGWRMLGTEPDSIAFNVYRSTAGGPKVKLNAQPIADVTYYEDKTADLTKDNSYSVRPVIDGKEGEESRPFLGKLAANSPVRNYIEFPLHALPGFTPNDASVADLDGDGEYEIILHQASGGIDTPSAGFSGEPVFQAYKLDGTLLWQINLGKNVRDGAHYTQFMVYDLDGDGRAEFVAKTAPGTVDGTNHYVTMGNDDPTADYRDQNGRIQKGPEYLTVFDGLTGKALDTVAYIPDRGVAEDWGGYGGNGGKERAGSPNRQDRFLACVAYLDGVHPSVVMCRGYYGRIVMAAWDLKNKKLTSRWVFDSKNGENPYSGQGAHHVLVADVDQDGRDEIVYHSMVVDDNGEALFSTGLRHGDASHTGDLDPTHPGLEVFGIHENENQTPRLRTPGVAMYDAKTGKVLWSWGPGVDVGRGVAADIDPRHPGAESWWNPSGDGNPAPQGEFGIYSAQGDFLAPKPQGMSCNFVIYWDGSLQSNLLDATRVVQYDWVNNQLVTLNVGEGTRGNGGGKNGPTVSADLFGDWREEYAQATTDNQALRIYMSTMPTKYRIYTLMHDPQYRDAIAWQNVAYNQPPHLSFDLQSVNGKAPKPNIILVEPTPAK